MTGGRSGTTNERREPAGVPSRGPGADRTRTAPRDGPALRMLRACGAALLLAAAGWGGHRAVAGELLACAMVESDTVHAGEPFELQVQGRASGDLRPSAPAVPRIEGLTVTPLEPRTRTTVVNWQVSRSVL